MEQESQQAVTETASATLGSLLYTDESRSRASEKGWLRLARASAAGDRLALLDLYERSHHLVFTLITRITGDRETAEELTLDIFHDIWLGASAYHPRQGTVLGWIMNLARSKALDRLRSERHTP